MMRSILKIIVVISFLSCKDEPHENFYESISIEPGIWRVPILKPFDLITTQCCRDWNLNYPTTLKTKNIKDYWIDSIYYQPNYISFHIKGSGSNWAVLDLSADSVRLFEDRTDFLIFLTTNTLNDSLYSAESIFLKFKSIRQLPWTKALANTSQ